MRILKTWDQVQQYKQLDTMDNGLILGISERTWKKLEGREVKRINNMTFKIDEFIVNEICTIQKYD